MTAQTLNELFDKANEQYRNEKYEQALDIYKSIEKQGVISTELYYNMGNCSYKLNKVAPTIYYYEKALMIDPLNEDAKNNLVFAKRLTIDNIEELPKTIMQKIDNSFIKKLSYNQWAVTSVILSVLGSALFLFFYFSNKPTKKRLFFITSLFSYFLLTLSLIITIKEYNENSSNLEAVIFSQEVSVKDAPTNNNNEVFVLHEGTKVNVLDTIDNWSKIRITDGKVGWILNENIKLLTLF